MTRRLFMTLLFMALPQTGQGQDFTPLFIDDFQINLWPGGVVPYTYDYSQIDMSDRTNIELQIRRLQDRFRLPDPANSDRRLQYIRFEPCDTFFSSPCPPNHLVIRNNKPGEGEGDDAANTCRYDPPDPHIKGSNPRGLTFMRVQLGVDSNTIIHELMHCLGVWHEFNRKDADTWLAGTARYESHAFGSTGLMPLLGNYDYDSVTHYSSYIDGDSRRVQYRDGTSPGNAFNRKVVERDHPDQVPSRRDLSRVLQYYAHEAQPNWGFFFSLGIAHSGSLPDTRLAPNVSAAGSPAIAYLGRDDFDLFIRGSDEQIYWKSVRTNFSAVAAGGSFPSLYVTPWTSLGCCFGSEPAALSRVSGEIDLVAIGAITGKLERNRFQDGRWQGWHYVGDGYPDGGLKADLSQVIHNGGYIGPAIAARSTQSLDVFVVRADGLLAVSTLTGFSWSNFVTLGRNYTVTARPAALAMGPTSVRLAMNENHTRLYEPLVLFPPAVASIQIQLGNLKAAMGRDTAPALTRRADAANPYRVLITNTEGRIAHRFANSGWRDIGGIPKEGSGPAAVSTGGYSALLLMNGEDAKGCEFSCISNDAPNPNVVIQPGGLWLRKFE